MISKQKHSIKSIIKRNGQTVKYNRRRIETAILKATASTGHSNPKLAASMAKKVENALLNTYESETMPSVENIQDVVERVLMESRLTRIAKNYIIYRHQQAMSRAARAYTFEVTDHVPYKKIYEILRWNMEHQCDTLESLNRIILQGKIPELVKEADKRYNDEVNMAAVMILERIKDIRIIIIAGPSSSGKTTTTIKISEQLKNAGFGFKTINIDNYFFDLARHPTDEFGDRDYEKPDALDLKLINKHLMQLLDGKTIKTPHYDFKSGRRKLNIHELCLKKNELLLIDSLHGLYEGMTQSIPDKNKFKVYIETLGQFKGKEGTFMRWSDNRLLRRMIRDRDHRNLQPIQTLTHWHYVRRSEVRNIIPFIKHADYIINSALPYELPILKHKLFRYISSAINTYKNDPHRLDAHIRANRIHEILKPMKPIKEYAYIPSDSIIREFIGGSRYKY